MCRYAFHVYKPRFACFSCRKSFRLRAEEDMPHKPRQDEQGQRITPCPQCGVQMFNIGIDFQVPKQADVAGWEAARILAQAGIRYQGCGCDAGGSKPRTPPGARRYVQEQREIK